MEKVKRLNIFIVDDDAMYVKALENYLYNEFQNITITSFATGEACLHSIHLEPDLILLDFVLNSEFPYAWNGIDIYKHIYRISPYTPVIMLSSQQNIDTVLSSLEKGCTAYIAKNGQAFGKIKQQITHLLESKEEEESGKQNRKELFRFTVVALAILSLTSYFLIR